MITADYLKSVNRQAGGKIEAAAAILGYTHYSSVSKLYGRHGVRWLSCRMVEIDGITDTFSGHCRRIGVGYKTAQTMRQRKGWTALQTLEYYKTKIQEKS